MEMDQKDYLQANSEKSHKLILGINVYEKVTDSFKEKKECDMNIYIDKRIDMRQLIQLINLAMEQIAVQKQMNLEKFKIDKKLDES